jgi:mono/diheme cytochrome c family protein
MISLIRTGRTVGAVVFLGALLYFVSTGAVFADCGFTGGDWKKGDKIFHETCVACHGEDGKGAIPGAPDFTKKGGVLSQPHKVIAEHIKNGFQAPGAPMAMPPRGGNPSLSDQDIKDVHAYLHHRFGCGKGSK